MSTIPAIDAPALQALPLGSLVQRMDDILLNSIMERYGTLSNLFPINLVSHVISTKKVCALSPETQRHVAHITFAYLIQSELEAVAAGMSNVLVYNNQYDAECSWQSPAFQLRAGAIKQYQIISSRIAMEIFMDLLYCVNTGQRLRAKRSKLKAFRKWLCDKDNEFHYFAHVLLAAYRFDRGIRTPEVHGTPKLPKRLLRLQRPSHDELNEPVRLTNALSGCWRPLLEILNGKRPSGMTIAETDMSWFDTYMTGTEKEIVDKLASMFDGIE